MTPTVPITIERIERALLVIAYLIELDGDVHVPMYEKFERELADLRSKADVRQRARERLNAFVGRAEMPAHIVAAGAKKDVGVAGSNSRPLLSTGAGPTKSRCRRSLSREPITQL